MEIVFKTDYSYTLSGFHLTWRAIPDPGPQRKKELRSQQEEELEQQKKEKEGDNKKQKSDIKKQD